MAAGMDAQHVEDKLTRQAKEAWEAYLAEKDPARSEKLEKRWDKAQDALDSFLNQPVAGGADPNQGCKVGPAWCAAAGGAPGGRLCPGPCHQAGGGPIAWVCR